MSRAGRPKTIAKQERADAVARARVQYKQDADPIYAEVQKILDERLAPHGTELGAAIRKADIAYFEAIGDGESARLLKDAA